MIPNPILSRRPTLLLGFLTAVLTGLALTAWQAVRATQAERRAAAARDASEGLLSEAIEGLRDKLLPIGKIAALQDLVTAADEYYQRLPLQLRSDETERHRVSLCVNRTFIAFALGNDHEQERYANEALRIAGTLLPRHSDNEDLRRESAVAMVLRCYLYFDRGNFDELKESADQLSQNCESWLQVHPKSVWAMRDHAVGLFLSAFALGRGQGKNLAAFVYLQKAAEIARKLRAAAGETPEVCEVEGLMHYSDAMIAGKIGFTERALADFDAAVSSFARGLELGGESILLRKWHAQCLRQSGSAHRDHGRHTHNPEETKRGDEWVKRSFAEWTKLVELEPGVADFWREIAWSHDTMANEEQVTDQERLRHWQEAVRCADEALKRQPNRPQVYLDKAAFVSRLAGYYLSSKPQDLERSANLSLDEMRLWIQSLALAGRIVDSHGIVPSAKRLVQAASAIASQGDKKLSLSLLHQGSSLLSKAASGDYKDTGDSRAAISILAEAEEELSH